MEFQSNKLDSLNESNYNNYWNNVGTQDIFKNKTVISYNDILNSLNMIVVNGHLHLIPKQKQYNNLNSQIINDEQKQLNVSIESNKRTLTPQEIKNHILLNYAKKIETKKRISEIKPKKLLFNTQNVYIAPSNNTQFNKLFHFSQR